MNDLIPEVKDLKVNNSYWTTVTQHANAVSLQDSASGVSLCCPLSCPPMSVARPFSLIDLAWVFHDIEDGYSHLQASRQRGVDPNVVQKACVELLRLGNMALRIRGELRGVRLKDPRAALVALGINFGRTWQPKLYSWRQHLRAIEIPFMSEYVWESWEDAQFGEYIEVSKNLGADLWLGFLVSLKFPVSKMVIKQIQLVEQKKTELESCILLSIGQGGSLTPVVEPRSHIVKKRDGRPAIYLHIANEGERVTDHTGPAFETGGLQALMLVIRLASVAIYGRQE